MTWISPMDHDNHHNKRRRGSKTFRVLEVELGGGVSWELVEIGDWRRLGDWRKLAKVQFEDSRS